MALDHLVLGLVAANVGHGYAIARRITELQGGRGSVQRSHVYAALARLERRGLIAVHPEPPARRPRRTFAATDAGRGWLAAWLDRTPEDGAALLRRTLLVKLAVRELLGERPSRRELSAERAARRHDAGEPGADRTADAAVVRDPVAALLLARARRHRDVELWLLDRLDAQHGGAGAAGPVPLTRSRSGSASR